PSHRNADATVHNEYRTRFRRLRSDSGVGTMSAGGNTVTASHLLAIDQGTTSTRAIVFDAQGKPAGSAAEEFPQHYPRPGWVEHDAEEIWRGVEHVVPRALEAAGISASVLAAIGVTNQR